MTTPRDALAAALGNAGYGVGRPKDLDRLLSALAAEGWVLVPDPAPLDVERLARALACHVHTEDRDGLIRLRAEHLAPLMLATCAAAIAREYAKEQP